MRSHPLYVPCARTRPATARTVSIVSATANDAAGGVFYSVSASVAGIALELRTTPGGVIVATATVAGSSGSGTIGSGLTGDHVLRATVPGAAAAVSGTVTVAYGSGAPDVSEDFSTYTSTANMLADPRDLYALSEDINTDRIALDTGVGYGASTKSMRYDYPARPGLHEFTISRSLDMRQLDTVTELWAKAAIRFSIGFSVDDGDEGYAKVLKTWEIYQPTQGLGRFGLSLGNTAMGRLDAEGPNDNYEAFFHQGLGIPELYDEEWHVIRWHIRLGSPTMYEYWIDDILQATASAASAVSELQWVALCKNMNQGPTLAQSLWWGSVKLWVNANDPGWE